MSKARDLGDLAGTATVMATDAEVATSIAGIDATPTALMTMGA